ncbi:MAG: hypothetical protein ACI30Q_10025 [Muribaculaceae bacterium]
MGFFNKLKSALGYSDSEYDEDDELDGFNPAHRTPYVNPFKKDETMPDLSDLEQPAEAAPTAVAEVKSAPVAEVEEKLPDGVFDGIITIINGNLPEFVRDCIDIEKERKAVSVAMGPKFRDYVLNLRRTSLEEARTQWIDERNALTGKLAQSNQRADEAVRKASEIKDRLMSEERQRRAIVERSHDLEARIADLEAQHEQEQLQNKGLLNKIKVMQLQVTDSQKDAEEITRLNKLINDQRTRLAKIVDLEAQIAELNAENDSLKRQLDEMQQSAEAQEIADEYKSKMEVANALINELRSTAAAKEQEAKALSEKLVVATNEITGLQDDLKAAQEELEIAAEIQEKIEQFEVIKERKDAEIRNLRNQLAQSKDADVAAASANSALAQSRSECDALKAQLAELQKKVAEQAEVSRAHDVETANQIDRLKTTADKAEKARKTMSGELDEARARVDELTATLNRYKADNMSFDVQVKNLKANIKDRDAEIGELRRMLDAKGVEVGEIDITPFNADEIGDEDASVVSAIDDIDNIDWLMPSPPSEPEEKPAEEPEREERRQPSNEIGAAQMSLFDD